MENLIAILQWAIPSGGLGAVVTWIVSSKIRHAREGKEIHGTYKALYEDVSNTLKELQDEMANLYKEIGLFRRSIAKMYGCGNYPDCPVRRELQNTKGNVRKNGTREPRRQPRGRNPPDTDNAGSAGESEPDGSGTEPP